MSVPVSFYEGPGHTGVGPAIMTSFKIVTSLKAQSHSEVARVRTSRYRVCEEEIHCSPSSTVFLNLSVNSQQENSTTKTKFVQLLLNVAIIFKVCLQESCADVSQCAFCPSFL